MFFSTSCVSSRHFWITLCSLSDDSWEFSLCHANKWILKVIVIIIYYLFLYAWCTCNSLDPAEAVVPFQKSSWKVLIYDNLPTPSNKMNIEQRSPSFLCSAEKQWCILPILKVSNQITIEMCVKKEKKLTHHVHFAALEKAGCAAAPGPRWSEWHQTHHKHRWRTLIRQSFIYDYAYAYLGHRYLCLGKQTNSGWENILSRPVTP